MAGLATALAIISCYGTGSHLGALSLLGISLSLDERAGAGAISVLAALAALLIGASSRRCRIVHPAVVAVLGFALILWTIYGAHSRAIELIGFALLLAATVLDWRERSASRPVTSEGPGSTYRNSWIRSAANRRRSFLTCAGATNSRAFGHIKGARNISYKEFPRRMREIDGFKTDAIVLVCRTLVRSAKAAPC